MSQLDFIPTNIIIDADATLQETWTRTEGGFRGERRALEFAQNG